MAHISGGGSGICVMIVRSSHLHGNGIITGIVIGIGIGK